MKLKEVDRTANIAWSPATHHPIYLAAGTAAQQLDATFSTTAAVELYTLNLAESGQDMELAGSLTVDSRLYKMVWGSFGMNDDTYPSGLLVGGAEQGKLSIWDPTKIINEQDPLVHQLDKHNGQVIALDINPFQSNLLASGSSESEIYIWDLNKPDKPMTPGSKAQLQQHAVNCVSWNRQVQHILGSSHGSNCVVWDLRKNEPIIKIRDSMSRIECNMICWHPDVATQLCIASEDDHAPVIQLWDLRCATSPLRLLEYHQRGIVSMAWCPQDSDLLLSSGKDSRILCWNPNSEARSGEVLYEVPTSNRWSFDVQWCPRNPGIISGCSFDGHISVYSIMGGMPPTQPSSKVAEAFPLDPFNQLVPQPTPSETSETMLKKAPKWLCRPIGASFGFGGKLVCFENEKPAAGHQQAAPPSYHVSISQVVTETELVERSAALENTLADGRYLDFCDAKIQTSRQKSENNLWRFLKANFTPDPRRHYLELLGFSQEGIRDKVSKCLAQQQQVPPSVAEKNLDAEEEEQEDEEDEEISLATNKMAGLNAFQSGAGKMEEISPFDSIASAAAAGQESSSTPLSIHVGNDFEGLVTEALLTANFATAVDVCLLHKRTAEAIILAIAGGSELLARTQKRVLSSSKSSISRLILSIVTRDFESVVTTCDLSNWKETLAIVLTYADGEQFTYLCNLLASRLEIAADAESNLSAQLCYVVAGNIGQLVALWNNGARNSHHALQDLIEKVMILRKAVESTAGRQELTSGHFARMLTDYAQLLAGEGCSVTALNYLGTADESSIVILRDRLYHSLGGQAPANIRAPPRPFRVIDVQPERPRPAPAPQPSQSRSRTSSANYTYQPPAPAPVVSSKPSAVGSAFDGYGNAANAFAGNQGYYQQPQQTFQSSTPGGQGFGFAQQNPVMPSSGKQGPMAKYGSQPAKQPATQPQPSVPIFDPYQQQQPLYPADYSSSPTSHHSSTATTSIASSLPPGAPVSGYASNSASSAWNDTPIITSSKKVVNDHPGAPAYEGLLYNPKEYEEQMRLQQQQQLHQNQQHQHQQPHHHRHRHRSGQDQSDQRGMANTADANDSYRDQRIIPSDHQVIQDILDRLSAHCHAKALNAPTKKKLEDVQKKLDILYEKLRSGLLSQQTLTGLHQIIQSVQQFDYNTALSIVAQIVNTGSFTEISGFMPGVKVLIQTAVQLQVYIQ